MGLPTCRPPAAAAPTAALSLGGIRRLASLGAALVWVWRQSSYSVAAVESGRTRRLSLKSYDHRRVVHIHGDPPDIFYQMDNSQYLLSFNATIPYSGFWFDDDEVVEIHRDNQSTYKAGVSQYDTLTYLPHAVLGQSPAMSLSPLDANICPCGESFKTSPTESASQSKSKSSEEEKHSDTQETICLLESASAKHVLAFLGREAPLRFRYKMVSGGLIEHRYRLFLGSNTSSVPSCDLLVHIYPHGEAITPSAICPETCLPVPYVQLPMDLVMSDPRAVATANLTSLLCSMNAQQYRGLHAAAAATLQSVKDNAEFLIHTALKRRREECGDEWLLKGSPIPRRPLHGLVIWVGSRTRFSVLGAQFSMLALQPHPGDPTREYAGWAATEDLYPCDAPSKCDPTLSGNHYRLFMPTTSVHTNRETNPGWSCAQRRPLRALAHALRLFDPNFVVLGDDDTFVSPHVLFGSKFDRIVREKLMKERVVVSEMHLSNRDVTRFGFIWGGSGYIFGKAIVDALVSESVSAPARFSTYWTGPQRAKALGVFYEAAELSKRNCPACVQMPAGRNLSEFPLDVQAQLPQNVHLVDLCSHMMSHRDTCHHSDHALCRCLTFGAHASFLHVSNRLTTVGEEGLIMGMNFYPTVCDPFVHITCHRFMANVSRPAQPIKLSEDMIRKYY